MSTAEMTVIATASHSTVSLNHSTSAVGGNSTAATARNCTFAFHFPSGRAGKAMPRRLATDRQIETPTSRTATIATAIHGKSPRRRAR